MEPISLLEYLIIAVFISAVGHPIAHRYMPFRVHFRSWRLARDLFRLVCGVINFVDLLLKSEDQIKPGWPVPLLVFGSAPRCLSPL